jgi:hypothetical protein
MLNPNNTEDLKKFFETNKHLSTYELAIVAGRSPSTIRNWKRKCGITLKESPFPKGREYKKKDVVVIADKGTWDCKDWFQQKYVTEGLGIPTIARIIAKSVSLVAGRLKKYDISTRPHNEAVKSNNQSCDEAWLYFNYATRDQYVEWCTKNAKQVDPEGGKAMSLAKCSTIAGVVPYTIYNWLVRFKIPMRDINEAMSGENNPFFGKKHSDVTKQKIRESYWKIRNPEVPPKETPNSGNADAAPGSTPDQEGQLPPSTV